jgi:hypothetical protein
MGSVTRVLAAAAMVALAACATLSEEKTTTVYSDDGVSELNAPETWRTRPNIGRSATLRLGDDADGIYLLVNTYLPHEIHTASFSAFAQRVSSALMKRLGEGTISPARELSVNGRPAVEYQVAGRSGSLPIVYLSTVVEGERGRHHLVSWSAAESFGRSRGAMREVIASFRESAQRRPERTRIDLVFDWPEHMTSTASVRATSNKRGEVIDMQARAVTRVRPLGDDELLISGKLTDRRFTPSLKDAEKAGYLERVVREATTDVPDYVVDREGDFVRIENLAPYLKRLEDALVNGLPEGPQEARAKARELVGSLVNEDMLSASLQDEWNNVVGNWAGGSYVPGQIYPFELTYQSPPLGAEVFPMAVTQQLVGRQACRKGASPDSCVRLVQTSRVSDPRFTRAMSAFVRRTVGAKVSIDKAEVLKRVEVIADPKTLLPYRTVVRETKRFVVAARGEAPRASEETRESVTTYTYQ